MSRAWIFIGVGIVCGFAIGVLGTRNWAGLARPEVEAAPTSVEDRRPARASSAARPQPVSRAGDCGETEAKLDNCYQALAASWANVSHPVEVAQKDSSYEAARRFSEAYYVDDEPEVVESRFGSEEAAGEFRQLLDDHDFAMEDLRVSCDPLPCVLELDVAYSGDAERDRATLDPLFDELEGKMGEEVEGVLPGYHPSTSNMHWGRDVDRRTYQALVSTHSEADQEELLESMVLFLEEVMGSKRFE